MPLPAVASSKPGNHPEIPSAMKIPALVPTFVVGSLLASAFAAEPTTVLAEKYHRTFSAAHPVLKRIRPGELIATKTIDSGGRDEKGEQRSNVGSNPLTGPFFVEGAEPGEVAVLGQRDSRTAVDGSPTRLPGVPAELQEQPYN